MCTAVYIGKDVSADGHTIIARSCDTSKTKNNITNIYCNKRVENVPNRSIQSIESKIKYELPPTTYKCLTIPIVPTGPLGYLNAIGNNEYGFTVTATITAYNCPEIQALDPFLEDGICEETLPEIMGKSCKNCKEAIDFIESTMAKNGNFSANSLTIADQNESWLIELYSGHQWAAIKLPTDKVSVYGNLFMIQTEYEMDNPDSFRCSKDLFEMPQKAGIAVMKDGKMSLAATYGGKNRLEDYSNLRTYMGHYYFGKSSAGEYNKLTRYPLFFDPDKKISLKEVFDIYRYRYEGTQYCPDTNGREDIRLIATEAQYNVHAIQIFEDVSPEFSNVAWTCLGNAEHSIFLPYSNLLTKVNEHFCMLEELTEKYNNNEYCLDQEDNPIMYDDNIAQVTFKRLCSLAEHDRKLYGAGVRQFWSEKEDRLIEEFKKVIQKISELSKDNQDAAIDYINEWTCTLQKETLAESKSMFDELMWYITGHIETLRYWFDFDNFCPKAEKDYRPLFKPTMCFKDKYLK